MDRIRIPFKTRTDTGNTFKAIGYIYTNNGFIVRQEIKLLSASVSTRILKKTNGVYKVETNTYAKMVKKSSVRKDVLGLDENKLPSSKNKPVSMDLSPEQLKDIEDVVNKSKTGTILSTLLGLLSYTSATGSNKTVQSSPIVIDGGMFDNFRFYNLFTNEFNKSAQTFVDNVEYDDFTIEQWVNHTRVNRLMFALYNFEKDFEFLKECGIITNGLEDKTYDEILGVVATKSKKENVPDIIDLYRRAFKKNVMANPKYKFDFVFNDTNKENTEAAHIYEVHAIKKREALEEWNLISDVDNCLLLTPSVHKAWDKEQIKIKSTGEIKNINMEPKRFERLFKPADFKMNFKLTDRQKMFLDKREKSI